MSATNNTLHFVAGDNRPVISCTLKQTSLDGYTITGRLKKPDDSSVLVPAVITDSPNGKFTITFASADIVAGRHEFDILFEHTDGGRFSEPSRAPITIHVRNPAAEST